MIPLIRILVFVTYYAVSINLHKKEPIK